MSTFFLGTAGENLRTGQAVMMARSESDYSKGATILFAYLPERIDKTAEEIWEMINLKEADNA